MMDLLYFEKKKSHRTAKGFLRHKNWDKQSGEINLNNVRTEENTEKSQSWRDIKADQGISAIPAQYRFG